MRSAAETAAIGRAKARLDRLDFYPRPVRTERVRILHTPWLFRIPGFRRFRGYEVGPLILIKHPLAEMSDDLIVHELCHVWQDQHRRWRMWLSYLYQGYRNNPHEVEARRAVAETRWGRETIMAVTDQGQAVLARHGEAIATVRAFAERSGAERVVLLIDVGDRDAALLECMPGGAVQVTDSGQTWELPAGAPIAATARELPDVRPAPATALALDADTGLLEAPLGAIANLARGVLGLARAFGGRSVATADFAARGPSPITIAARDGEPLVVASGDTRFTLPSEI